MPVDTTRSVHNRDFRFPCPYANCGRWFKSRKGATYHGRAKHKPSEPLALDSIPESDQSIPLLHDEHSDNASSDLPNSDPFSVSFSNANGYNSGDQALGEDGEQDKGGSVPPQLDDHNWAVFEDNDQDRGSSPDRPHLNSDFPDPRLDTLGGDNLTNPWTEDLDPSDEEPETQSHPGTYHRYREYHPYLTGEY
jgi:hypothetical protein